MFRGTITAAPDFDPSGDAESLYNAMKGIGKCVHPILLLGRHIQTISHGTNIPCVPQVVIRRPYWTWSPQEAMHRGSKSLQHTKTTLERYNNALFSLFSTLKNNFFKYINIYKNSFNSSVFAVVATGSH